MQSCMEYYCHVWASAPSCYLNMLNKLQKQVRRTVGPTLAASLEPLAHCQIVASLSSFFKHYFGSCSTGLAGLAELAELAPLSYCCGSYT